MIDLVYRNPKTDPPEVTGVILVLMHDFRPALVNVDEGYMAYTDGENDTEPASPCEWRCWAEIPLPEIETPKTRK